MSRSIILVVLILIAVSVTTATAETDQPKAMIGATVGLIGVKGAATPELGNGIQSMSLGLGAMWFHSSWFMLAGDFTKALNNTLEVRDSDGDVTKFEGSSWYIDILAGARHTAESGSFAYLAAGLTVAAGESQLERIDSTGDTRRFSGDIPTTAGIVIGAGGAIPVSGRALVFFKLRQRLAVGEGEWTLTDSTDVPKVDYDLGGLETAVGVGFSF